MFGILSFNIEHKYVFSVPFDAADIVRARSHIVKWFFSVSAPMLRHVTKSLTNLTSMTLLDLPSVKVCLELIRFRK